MSAAMDIHNCLVEDVVRLQLTSPAFAEYCVAHVTDPKHRFLFADDGSRERQAYVCLLQRTAHGSAGGGNVNISLSSANATMSTETTVLWAALLEHFSTPCGVRGPHMPHMFRTVSDLSEFLCVVDNAQRGARAAAEAAVQQMMGRLTMTETFLFVLWQRCETLTREARAARRRVTANDETEFSPNDKTDKTAIISESDINELLQCAGTILFVASMLLLAHSTMSSGAGEKAAALRYGAAFEVYLLRMVETVVRSSPKDSKVVQFVRETVAGWAAGNALGADALSHMTRAVTNTQDG